MTILVESKEDTIARYIFTDDAIVLADIEAKSLTEAAAALHREDADVSTAYAFRVTSRKYTVEFQSITEEKVIIK